MRTCYIAAVVCILVAHAAAQNMMINPTFAWGGGWWNSHGSWPAFSVEAGVSQDTGSDCVKIVSTSSSNQNGMWQNSDPTLAADMASVWAQYSTGKNFKFSGWSKPTSVVPLEGSDVTSEFHYSIWMTAQYSDASEETTVVVPFDRLNESWQQASGVIVPLAGKTVKNVIFNAFLREHEGSALFDNYFMETYQPVADATNSHLLSKPEKADIDADVHAPFLVRDQENVKFVLAADVQAVVTGPSQPTVTITAINGNNNERDIKLNFSATGQYSVSITVNGIEADTWSVTVEDIPFNYISDPSFEIFNGLWALSGTATLVDNAAQCNSGAKCIQMVTGNDNFVGNWNLPVGQTTASQVVFSAFYKTVGSVPEPLAGQTLGFYLDVKGHGTEVDHIEINFDHTTTTWTEFRYPYNPTFPIKSVGFYLMSRWVGAGGEFWVDDVAIEQPISAAPTATQSTVQAPAPSYLARTSHPLTITARDSEGIVATTGGSNFNAKLTRNIDSFVRNLEVLDMQNGQYSVDVWASSAGNWKLEVFLDADLVDTFDILFFYDLGMELVNNPGFENLQSGNMMNWTPLGLGFTISAVASSGARSIKCESGDGDVTYGASQDVFVNQASPAPLVLTASSRGESTGTLDADYALIARVTLASGEVMPNDFVIAFPKQSTDWVLGSVLIAAPTAIRSVLITPRFANHVGYAYFDDISLVTAQASASGAMSVCSGSGVNSAEANVDATFTVHARDSFGIPLLGGTNPSDTLIVSLSYSDLAGNVLLLPGVVTPSSSSPSYSVTYRPATYGRHTLEVKMNGEHVGASPFTLYVNPDFEGPSELIENPSLNTERTDVAGSPTGWAPFGAYTWTDNGCRSGHCAEIVSTGESFTGGVTQTGVPIPTDRNQYPLRFSAWTRASGLVAQPGLANYCLYMDVVYTDGTTATVWRDLAWDQDQWHFEEIVFMPERAMQSASFYALFRNIAAGSAHFDDLSVHMTAPSVSPAMSVVSRAASTDGLVGEQETMVLTLRDKAGYPIASTLQDINDFNVVVKFLNGCTGLLETVVSQVQAGTNAGEMFVVFTPQAGGDYTVRAYKTSTNEEFASSPVEFKVVALAGEGAAAQQGASASGSQSSSSSASTGSKQYKIGSVELFSKGALSHALSAGAAFCTTMVVLVAVNVVLSKSTSRNRPPTPDRTTTTDTVAKPVDAEDELRTISGRTVNNIRRRTQSDRDPARMNDAILKTGKVF